MSEYLRFLPYVLFASPFVVAAIVLVWAKINENRARDDEETVREVVFPEDLDLEEVRSTHIRKRYISYSLS